MIEAVDTVKVLGEGAGQVQALKGVSLAIAGGELTLLMGPSGSGKTTLLSMLGCMLTPTQRHGARAAASRPTAPARKQLAKLRREHIGFVFQSYHLFPTLNALDNVRLALDVRGESSLAREAEGEGGAGDGRPGAQDGLLSARTQRRRAAARRHRARHRRRRRRPSSPTSRPPRSTARTATPSWRCWRRSRRTRARRVGRHPRPTYRAVRRPHRPHRGRTDRRRGASASRSGKSCKDDDDRTTRHATTGREGHASMTVASKLNRHRRCRVCSAALPRAGAVRRRQTHAREKRSVDRKNWQAVAPGRVEPLVGRDQDRLGRHGRAIGEVLVKLERYGVRRRSR